MVSMCEEITAVFLFASYFCLFVWISRVMCGLGNTEQHLHTCQRSIAGANSQPCQENGDLITTWEALGNLTHGQGASSHNADSFIFQWFYLSVIHLIPGWPRARYQFNKYVTRLMVCTGTGGGAGEDGDEPKSRLPRDCGQEEYLDYNMCIMGHPQHCTT